MMNDLWLKRRAKRKITGRMRLRYSFLIPKYPIGTFTTAIDRSRPPARRDPR